MNKQQVVKKLELAVKNKVAKIDQDIASLKRRKQDEYTKREIERSVQQKTKLNYRNIVGLSYRARDNYFTNSSGTCEFFPETMSAHSYNWYSLLKVIKGKVVLNTYRYSMQTIRHIDQLSDTLDKLGVKYMELEAPRGLQNLEAAREHALFQISEMMVREKYARKKSRFWLKRCLKFREKQLSKLAEFGVKTTAKMRKQALEQAEQNRLTKNRQLREKAELKRAISKLEIVSDMKNQKRNETGLHVTVSSDWQWDDQGQFTGKVSQWDLRKAVEQGFTKIIVHKTEPRHLYVVPSENTYAHNQ